MIVGVILFFLARNSIESRQVFYIAYVGRYSRVGFDELHVRSVEKYLDEVNAKNPGIILKLKALSNEHSSQGSETVYQQILEDPHIVAVIDNTWGSELRSVAPLIAKSGLPVISINADKGATDFGGNAVFLGYDDQVPFRVTTFAREVLHVENPIFIGEKQYALTDIFREKFQEAGIQAQCLPVNDFREGNESEQEKLFADLDGLLESWRQIHSGRPTVIVNTHGSWGLQIIKYIEAHQNNVDILGGPFIIDWANYDGSFGRNERRNRLIIFTYPHDAVSNKVHTDLKEIRTDGGLPEKPNEFLFVKRSLDAVSIIRGALLYNLNLNARPSLSRQGFIDFFRTKLAGKRYAGEYDLYIFDNDLRVADERRFEQYFRDEVHSFERQVGPKGETRSTVEVGIYNVRLTNIDPKNRSFHADFICTVISDQWGLADKIYFPNARTAINHEPISSPQINGSPVSNDKPGKRTVERFKASGDFNMDVDLRRYPADTQQLRIQLAIKDPQADRPSLSIGQIELESDSLDEWTIEDYYVTKDVRMEVWPSVNSGLDESLPEKSETLNFRIQVSRRWEGPFVTITMPLFIIALAAIALLYIRDASFAAQGQICVGIFLGLITYSFQFAQFSPMSNALTIGDKMFYETFFIVLMVFLKVSLCNSRLISAPTKRWITRHSVLLGNVTLISYLSMFGLIWALA
ncbi:MAG TPA: hypothetical protein VJ875_13690 [Pyrinomonadaceae bacterium]|nr:hypothetical protein [Pyrinomonadaceae bacterium]